jgi:hypothetical protein
MNTESDRQDIKMMRGIIGLGRKTANWVGMKTEGMGIADKKGNEGEGGRLEVKDQQPHKNMYIGVEERK